MSTRVQKYISRSEFWKAFDFTFFREQFAYAVPFGLAGIIWVLQNDIHFYFVGYRFSDAELAIYAYGCFQLPLIMMLAESVTSVLIPKMSELQSQDDKKEMFRLTVRAMQKLSFFYFPLYAFLLITAETLIITLFTKDYIASLPVFLVNITLLPFHILVSDPIVRAYKEFSKFLLILRIITFAILFGALMWGIQNLNLSGIITIVIIVKIVESLIAETIIFFKLNLKLKDLKLLSNIVRTAVISLIAGSVTYFFYIFLKPRVANFGETILGYFTATPSENLAASLSGLLLLGLTFTFFAMIYLPLCNFWGLIDEEEKQLVMKFIGKLKSFTNGKIENNTESQV